MGYFSNGTEGRAYYEEYCLRCVHMPENPDDGGCPVWLLHLLHNYDECNKKDSFLHVLIPRAVMKADDGFDLPYNAQCTMFHERPKP